MTQRIIVTGGSGFIGRMVCQQLIANGWQVHAWMRGKNQHNLSDLSEKIVCRYIDIYDEDAVLGALKEADASEMIHLAWGGLPNYLSCHHMDTELPQQIRFVRTVIRSGVRRLTQIGTCFEYGAREGRLSEHMECNPTNPYGYAKLSLLRYVEFLRREAQFSHRWRRLFYTYGDGQGAGSLYTQLRNAYQRGDVNFDMSEGHQIRDFSPISEVAAKITALHALDIPDGVYNVCSGKPVSVRQMVERWIADWNYSVNLNLGHFPIPSYEPLAFWGDNAKVQAFLRSSENPRSAQNR